MADFCFVVPVYKVPYDMLQNCIDSILNQTYRNIELILVDDGSPDDCGKLCDRNAEKDKRIKVIHKTNGGLSDARNTGTRLCESDWITFVDGDDWIEPDFAESFLERVSAQEKKADFYMYNGYRNYSQKEVLCIPYFPDGKRFCSYQEREELQKECCMVPTRKNGNRLFIGSGWAKVYDLSFLKENNLYFTIVPYGEDSIFFFETVEEAGTVEYVSKAVYHYRDTEGGMVNGYRKTADTEQDTYVQKIFEIAQRYNKSEAYLDALYLRVFIAMQRCVSQKFFHSDNPDGLLKRWKECAAFLEKPPYRDVFKHIDVKQLNRNSKIKYWLFRTKLYGLMNVSRSVYNLSRGNVATRRSGDNKNAK